MAQVFLGSLMLVPYNFAPLGYAFCNGQLLSITQNSALFSLLGVQFGGDGRTTFGLPNLQGSLAVGQGQAPGQQSYNMGDVGGSPTVTLIGSTVPQHNHSVMAGKEAANLNTPTGNVFALSSSPQIYNNTTPTPTLAPMNAQSLNPVGANQQHNNMMPYQGLQWIIALQGIFPPRS
jgi:microcystin-dependent protein